MKKSDPISDRWADLPDETLARVLTRGDETSRHSVLWPLTDKKPLSALLTGEEAHGTWSVSGAQRVPYTIRRTADSPPSFELIITNLPTGFRPDCLTLLGDVNFPRVSPATLSFEIPHVSLPSRRNKAEADHSPALACRTLDAATDSDEEPARKQTPKVLSNEISFRVDLDIPNPSLTVVVDENIAVCRCVVAEMQGVSDVGQDVLDRRLVNLDALLDDGRRKGSLDFDKTRFRAGSTVTATVRGLTASDLDLFDKNQVNEFLAERTFLPLPLTDEGGRLTCRARWAAQKRLATDPNTNWALRLAVPAGEVRS